MSLPSSATSKLSDSAVRLDEEVREQCLISRELESIGEYEKARIELAGRWNGVGQRPNLSGLSDGTQAELLLRAGTLSGWIGSAQQIEGAQEFAKNLISESARKFQQLGLGEREADASIDLAICYWREGALDEARVTLNEVLTKLKETTSEVRLRALANLALLERVAGRYKDALQIQTQAADLFEQSSNHALRGNFHNVYAQVLKELGLAESREDYIDRALIEFSAAGYHFEQAGHARFQARVENNLGSLLGTMGRFEDAHQHLDNGRALFLKLKDRGSVAQVDETRAKTLLAQGRNSEAVVLAGNSVLVFEGGDEHSSLAEALTTQATALARLKKPREAFAAFSRAIEVAALAGDTAAKGLACLTAAEELASSLTSSELLTFFRQAESLLPVSQNPGVQFRLGECARKILSADTAKASASEPTPGAESTNSLPTVEKIPCVDSQLSDSIALEPALPCSLEAEVLRYEGKLIKRALESAGGSVTRAARLLGTTHQGLAFILNGRQRSLMSSRKPVRPRRKSIIRYH